MLLDILTLAPYLALAASCIVTGSIAVVCFQTGWSPEPTGFGHSGERRRVPPYRGAVKASRESKVQEAA